MSRSGPVYDDAVKALCAAGPASLCPLLGIPVSDGSRVIRQSEVVPASTLAVDALVTVTADLAVHIEFQTRGQPHFARRMLTYWLHLTALPELEHRDLAQHVIVLGDGHVSGGIRARRLRYSYDVHYLRDQPVDLFLNDPHLAPFAALARLPDPQRAGVLSQALALIATVEDDRQRRTLTFAALDLAALRLPSDTIDAVWEDSVMPIPSYVKQLHDRAVLEGLEQGLERGVEQAAAALLRHRFGPDGRIPAIAKRLAQLGPDAWVARIDEAADLDELTD